MANKQYNIEIRLNPDADLGIAVLFFQKLLRLIAKYGVTYFKDVVLNEDYKEVARYETGYAMSAAIKEYKERKQQENPRFVVVTPASDDIN